MITANEVKKLYLQYGFVEGPACEQYLVFFSQSGYFQNAEIVLLDSHANTDTIDRTAYENMGYSVRIKKFGDITEVQESLFNGFFNVAVSNRKLLAEYAAFCEQQNCKLVNSTYEYICGDYVENGLLQEDNVINRICEIFSSDERQLIILEASAGYGKTCTSFEVIQNLVSKMPTKIPLMTELSKNRKASVFRYVLLSEIDQKFPTLSSELVTKEIQEGRIFLVIDGFDELLSKSYMSSQENEKALGKDAQTMLDTIAQLLPKSSKTKILLTTRKSSIFVGEEFDEWVMQHLVECNITRLQLTAPSLRDWIGGEKIELLKKNNIDLQNILNPVLLALLRSEPIESFEEKYTSNDKIIDQYLELLLKREQIRQEIPLNVQEQIAIMSDLAAQMVQFDISAEEIEFIKSLISDIVSPKIEEYQKRYEMLPGSWESKPSEGEFLNKLSHHALLDRVSLQGNLIGFINEFIFGVMIAKAVVERKLSPTELQGKYLDIVITACAAYSYDKRKELYDIIASKLTEENAQRQINASMNLINSINGEYDSEYFDGIFFGNKLSFCTDVSFKNCIFSDCIFSDCDINTEAFSMCQFYNCSFYNNRISTGETLNCELIFLSCTGHEEFASAACRKDVTIVTSVNYERVVLEQFWKPGYEIAEPRRAFQTLVRGVAPDNRQPIVDAIEELVRKEILVKKLHVYEFNFEKMDLIREIVQR